MSPVQIRPAGPNLLFKRVTLQGVIQLKWGVKHPLLLGCILASDERLDDTVSSKRVVRDSQKSNLAGQSYFRCHTPELIVWQARGDSSRSCTGRVHAAPLGPESTPRGLASNLEWRSHEKPRALHYAVLSQASCGAPHSQTAEDTL